MPCVLLEAFVTVLIKCKLKFYCSDVFFMLRKLGIEFSVTFCLADFHKFLRIHKWGNCWHILMVSSSIVNCFDSKADIVHNSFQRPHDSRVVLLNSTEEPLSQKWGDINVRWFFLSDRQVLFIYFFLYLRLSKKIKYTVLDNNQ